MVTSTKQVLIITVEALLFKYVKTKKTNKKLQNKQKEARSKPASKAISILSIHSNIPKTSLRCVFFFEIKINHTFELNYSSLSPYFFIIKIKLFIRS